MIYMLTLRPEEAAMLISRMLQEDSEAKLYIYLFCVNEDSIYMLLCRVIEYASRKYRSTSGISDEFQVCT